MWKSKKVIVSVIVGVIVLVGCLAGSLAFAAEETDVDAEARHAEMLGRVAVIYEENTGVALDTEQLEAAMQQAGEEMRDAAMQERLDALVAEGTITQEEADEYSAWLDARPDSLPMMGPRGFGGHGPRGPHGRMMPGMSADPEA